MKRNDTFRILHPVEQFGQYLIGIGIGGVILFFLVNDKFYLGDFVLNHGSLSLVKAGVVFGGASGGWWCR